MGKKWIVRAVAAVAISMAMTGCELDITLNPLDMHANTRAEATGIPFDSPTKGRFDPGDDVDYFEVGVAVAGTISAQTTGSTDTIGVIEDADGGTLAVDNDGGAGTNFYAMANVAPGRYFVRVTGESIGNYVLIITFTAAE